MPSRQVSRNAFTCSGSRVMWSALPSFTSRLVVDHWKLRVELDAVGRVDVDALHLAAQALALGQAGHHLQRVAEDHAVRPVLVVLVELGLVGALGHAVEVGEQVGLRPRRLVRRALASGAAGRRSAPSGGPSPGCRAAARGRRGRSSPARPCRARRAAGRGRGCAARRRRAPGSAPSFAAPTGTRPSGCSSASPRRA